MNLAANPKIYTQNDEQQAILECVRHVDNNRFLDIGAYHFETFSNTAALRELGWQGVMIEPAPHLMSGLVRDLGKNPNVTLVCAAMATEPGLIKLHVTADMLSTTSAAFQAERADIAEWLGVMFIQAVTFDQVSNWFEGFEFVSIDAEGTSVDLALDMLARGWRPTCFCVEEDGRMNELCGKVTQNYGYKLVYSSQENAVFAR
jgi:FkbM family methyltransferase